MTFINVKLTPRELHLLTTLASDQLFRKEFIDSRIPGNRFDPEEMNLGKKLVVRLKGLSPRDYMGKDSDPRGNGVVV